MHEKIERMIETDFQLQKLFMNENPERIEFFEPESSDSPHPEPAVTRKASAASSERSSVSKLSASAQPSSSTTAQCNHHQKSIHGFVS